MSTKVVERKPLSAWERSYIPSFLGGLGVTWNHFKRITNYTVICCFEKWRFGVCIHDNNHFGTVYTC